MEQVLIASSALLWLFCLGNFLLTLALIRKVSNQSQNRGLRPGQVAPPFTATTITGQTVSRDNYLGRAVVFLFISPTCVPCLELIPSLNTLYAQAAKVGVELVLVSLSDMAQIQTLVESATIQLPVLVSSRGGDFEHDYQIPGTPAFCMLDVDGHVQVAGIAGTTSEWRTLIGSWERDTKRTPRRVSLERKEPMH